MENAKLFCDLFLAINFQFLTAGIARFEWLSILREFMLTSVAFHIYIHLNDI